MKKTFALLFIGLAMATGMLCGFFIGRSEATVGNVFWSGIAKGTITTTGAVIQPAISEIRITPNSVGQEYYPDGFTFDLKNMNVGQVTDLALYVRNGTKGMANVYPVILSTPNLQVQSDLSNANLYPNGWARFVFQIKALDIGACSLSIKFVKSN